MSVLLIKGKYTQQGLTIQVCILRLELNGISLLAPVVAAHLQGQIAGLKFRNWSVNV